MASDPQVDLIFSHFIPRYVATGVDPNDIQRLVARIDRWADWCRIWSEEAHRHELLGDEASAQGRSATAGEVRKLAALGSHLSRG